MGDRFVARNSPLQMSVLLIGALLLAAGGLWLAGLFGPPPRPGREWFGWLAASFFGLAGALGARRLFDRADRIVVDRNGIYWRHWSEATIPWSAIRAYSHRSLRGQQFICLTLKDPTQFPRSGAGAWLTGIDKSLGFGDIALNVSGTDRRFRELAAAVSRHAPPELRPR